MELLSMMGAAPGTIAAVITHQARLHQISVNINRHPAGGWQVASAEGLSGPRCRSVAAAILLEAAEIIEDRANEAFAPRAPHAAHALAA